MTGLELLAIQAGIQGIGALADRRRTRKQQEAQQPLLDQARQDVQSAFGSLADICLLYTSPSPRDGLLSRMPSSA